MSVKVDSEEGVGTTVSIKIPLTLAIVSALIVESAGERFAIPQLAVQELVMASANGVNKIEMIKGSPVYRLRDHLLPLVYLDDLLNIKKEGVLTEKDVKAISVDQGDSDAVEGVVEDGEKISAKPPVNDNSYIVVTKVGGYSFGILVNRVFDTEEIVVKPVASIIKHIELFSGNTILGDGSVIMILDPAGIARQTGEITLSDTTEKTEGVVRKNGRQKTSLILFNAHDGTPKTVPLELVSRLEDVDLSKVEYSNGKMMIQYRGGLMPLVKFDDQMELGDAGIKPTLVFSDGRRSMGLMVSEILDIIEDYINVEINSETTRYLGSAIVDGKATDVINVGHFLSVAYADWFSDHGGEDFSDDTDNMDGQKRILIVDDSQFFRNMLSPILGVSGYLVDMAEGPTEAMELLENGEVYDAIVSDIEMPDMNGFDFARTMKASRWSDIPMIALTSHATDGDRARGVEVGFDDYITKFDRETLLNALSEVLRQVKNVETKIIAGVSE